MRQLKSINLSGLELNDEYFGILGYHKHLESLDVTIPDRVSETSLLGFCDWGQLKHLSVHGVGANKICNGRLNLVSLEEAVITGAVEYGGLSLIKSAKWEPFEVDNRLISNLQNCKGLRKVIFEHCLVCDTHVAMLSQNRAIVDFSFVDTEITDHSLDIIEKCPWVTRLNLSRTIAIEGKMGWPQRTHVTSKRVEAFQEARPDVTVIYEPPAIEINIHAEMSK